MNNKKVLLVCPPSRAKTARPPLGLMYLSSYLLQCGIDNDIIDIKGDEPPEIVFETILRRIEKEESDIIGITCLVTEIEIVEEMCRRLREIKPEAAIVLGGAQPTTHPEHFTGAQNSIDYFVIGEGEITFAELVREIRKGGKRQQDIRKIDGLAWFESGEIKRSKPRDLILNLDSLPLPAYEKVDMDYYTRPTSWGSRPILISLFWIFSSRGCPYQCRFCVAHEIFGRRVRQRDFRKVVDEIEHLVTRYRIDGIYFYDESFTVSKKRVIDICGEIRDRNLKIVFGCQTRVNLISEEMLKEMARVGFLQIDFGIESGSEKMLKTIQKDITVAQIREAVRECKKYGIRIFANMMLNLPGETLDDLNASINLMKELNCNVVIWNVTVPYPGTFLDKKLSREDYRKLMSFPSSEAYDLLETKYKFASYDANLRELVDRLYSIFPHPRYLHLTLNINYIKRWFLFIDFIWNIKYVKMLIRSKRKIQYVMSLFTQRAHG